MKKFRKIMSILLVCLLAGAVLTACGETKDNNNDSEQNQTDNTHTHTAGEEWLVDKDNHWHECVDDGEKTDLGAHDIEDDVCTVCGVEIVKNGENTDIYFYDEKENWIRCIHYDAEGNVSEDTAEYTYDENGNLKTIKIYADGTLSSESECELDSEGYSYEARVTVYSEDGTKQYYEYNSYGDTTKETVYKADGSVESDLTTEYVYSEDGKKMSEKTYSGETLVKEVKTIFVSSDSWGGEIYNYEITTYNEDGTKTVETVNENGEPVEG